MKKKGNGCDYLKSRNENLQREFFARLGRNGRTVKQAMADISRAGADRFYISEERAYSEVKKLIDKEGLLHDRLPNRLAMLREIQRRTAALMVERPDLSLRDAVFEVVNSPAPSFYLTPGSIRHLLYRSIRERC